MKSKTYEVILKITLTDGEKKEADHSDLSDSEYIQNELGWLEQSFQDFKVIKIREEK